MTSLTIFMSRPDWNEPGGPTYHLPTFIEALSNRPDICLRTFVYGNRRWGGLPRRLCMTLPVRVLIMLADLLVFLGMCLRYGRPDLLHLNSTYEKFGLIRDIPYMALCRLLGFGCLVKTHGSDEALLGSLPWFWRTVQQTHFRLSQIITFLSPAETRQFQELYPAYATRFHTAKNIVIPRATSQNAFEAGRILFGGRFVEKKNIPALLAGFAAVAGEFPEATLTMAGSGPLEASLRDRARELGIADRLVWTGWVDRSALAEINARCPIVVFTSTGSEGMPMMLLEGLNSHSKVVTTSVRFTRSYPVSDLGVVEIEGATAQGIAAGLRQALAMPPLGPASMERRRDFLDQFRAETVVGEFVDLYRLLKQAHSGD